MRGARPLVKAVQNKAVVTALREVAAGHVTADHDLREAEER